MVSVSGGASRTHMIGDLKPYQNYTFKLGVCNSEGCVNSSQTYGTTQEDGLFTFIYPFFMKSILKKKNNTYIKHFLSMFVYMGVRVEGNSEMKIHSAMQILF